MKKSGVYIVVSTGEIWICNKVEHYPESVIPDGSPEFSLIVSGLTKNKKIHRCLIKKHQFNMFKRIGDL